ncbi:DUF2283 domain-containing protein [Candidatus Pacearchaeota archaeon]|nr:DUF2283 domain-containing protein [Candidatus Pacearchaeota archaeon]
MNGKIYDIYYDEEGDFLEISFDDPPETEYTEDLDSGIFVTKDEKTDEIKSIGILDFKKRPHVLRETLQKYNLKFPLKIAF